MYSKQYNRINPDENLNRFIHADEMMPNGCWNCQFQNTDDLAHCSKCAVLHPNEDPSIRGGWEAIHL